MGKNWRREIYKIQYNCYHGVLRTLLPNNALLFAFKCGWVGIEEVRYIKSNITVITGFWEDCYLIIMVWIEEEGCKNSI